MTKRISQLIIFFILSMMFIRCQKELMNKPLYTVKVGETFDFYVSSNSCCPSCWLNKNSLRSIELVEEKEINQASNECVGCVSLFSYVFRALKPGQDTILFFYMRPGDSCSKSVLNSYSEKPKFSIVHVID